MFYQTMRSTSLSRRLAGIVREQRVKRKIVPFGEWLPDRADFANPGATEALNVIPTADGYRPFPALSAVSSNALTARCQGAIASTDNSGNVYLYAGDASKLYRQAPDLTLTDVSKSGGYAIAADGFWEGAQFGTQVLMTDYDDAVQEITVGASDTFADLITSTDKPKARHIAVVGNFVVLGWTNDTTDGERPGRVWWCGLNASTGNGNPADFTPAASTQCDFQDIPDAGGVQKIIGGADYGLIVMERGIYRMTYVGSPLVFRFDPIERSRGTPFPGSVIGLGRLAFYISEEGIFATDGIQSIPIGNAKVDKWLWDQLDTVYRSRLSSAVDPVNKLVLWGFPGTGATSGNPNTILIYNWAEKKFSYVSANHEIIFRAQSQGYTLDTLDTFSTDLDALPFSLDSRAWTGGELTIGAFNTSHVYGTFTGANLAATIETSEFQPHQGYSDIQHSRPLIDGGTITAALASRNALTDTVTFGTARSMITDGECPTVGNGRYHRLRASIAASGTWTHAQGMEVASVAAGVP